MTIPVLGVAHVRLTVTDIARSRAFYEQVLGFTPVLQLPPDADAATRQALGFLFGGVIYRVGNALLGLRPVAPHDDRFDEDRVGLDHLSFAVATRAELDAACRTLQAHGVAHGDVKDIGHGFILEFRDPDGIALELSAPAG
ncbi:VOC family protein [Actinoplanes teichomyceticus]|uniref:Catechol 2,3-dioxygenase-like lactoylglutathione lyase family enzyme n=1 Tax=Actinoplanes teichomyceticus TaxID=1867 RepID=A0A561VMV9_ACTTI|nr:VOC family protein [Actinoplanes teichomyceticus]TWG12959.1 catechol 2,3-dioxygenase-like lactoylglutathione lyase family enzyme [Actinoplanes teichomyceticus]GIF16971.1 glyoxalase [Actinoplanes teichomyceticus]